MFFFEYKSSKTKPSSRYTSQSQIILLIFKKIVVLLYEFLPKNNSNIVISFLTVLISLFLLIHFIKTQPFYNQKTNCLYLCMYFLFFWSSIILLITILLKESSFSGGIGLLFIGYPVVLIGCLCMYWNAELNLVIKQDYLISSGYEMLKKTENFVTIIERSAFEHNRKEQIVLLGYLQHKQESCVISNNTLKQLLQVTVNSSTDKTKNNFYNETKIMLIQYVEFLYKIAISKFPTYIRLRLSYALFLFEKLNKKQKGMFELETIKTLKKTLEEDYLLYTCTKYLEEEMSLKDEGEQIDCVSALAYKGYVNNFMSLIIKVSMFYTEFWTLLLLYEEDDSQKDNFIKMSELGRKISQTVIELNETFQKIEKINKHEHELTKLYAQFLSEILNDNKQALLCYEKLADTNDKKAKYDENNLFTLNFKNLSRSEEYQYIILNAQNEYFGIITNISLSVCSLLGFIREELIGQNVNILLPDILQDTHDKALRKYKTNFRKEALYSMYKFQNQENSTLHSKLKDVCAFARNKAKYLTKLVFKAGIIVTEDGDNFFIAKIIFDHLTKISNSINKVCYILTDNDFIIQNFSSNALKMLNLNSSLLNHSVDITEFIKEFNDEFIKHIMNIKNNDISQSKKQIKTFLINKKYRNSNIITWSLEENGSVNRYCWRNSKQNFLKNYTLGNNNGINESPYEFSTTHKNKTNFSHNGIVIENTSLYEPKSLDTSTQTHSNVNLKNNSKSSHIITPNVFITELGSSKIHKTNEKEANFYLSISDVLISKKQLGFLFKFERIHQWSMNNKSNNQLTKVCELKEDSIANSISSENNYSKIKDNSDTIVKEKSAISDNISKKEDNIINHNFVPEIHNVFNLDFQKLAFIQEEMKDTNELRDELRKIAFSKITNTEQLKESETNEEQSENEEEEDELSSFDYQDRKNSSSLSSNSSSSKKNNNNTNTPKAPKFKSSFNLSPLTPFNQKHNDLNDFYRVDLTKIRYFCYNFKTRIIEEIKQSTLLSEADLKTKYFLDDEMKLKTSNNPDANSDINSMDENTDLNNKSTLLLNTKKDNHQNEKFIIINQIQKALNDKHTETEVIKLYVISIIIFLLFISISTISLILYQSSSQKILTFFDLVFQSTDYLQGLLLSIFSVRELTLLTHEGYKNIYEPNRTLYIQEMFDKATSYFQKSTTILGNLNAILNDLPAEEKTQFQSSEIEIIMLTNKRFTQKYLLSMENALMENTMALYHVSLLNFTDVISLNQDVFYFLKNSLNNIMIAAEEQINIFLENFLVRTTNIRKYYIIFTVIVVITYIICYIVYMYFLEQVEHRKKSYLAIFYEIGKGFILSSLSKCEHFSQKLQLEKKIESNNNHTQSFSSSSFIDKLDESQNFDMNTISTNISSNLRKEFASQINKEKKKQNKNVLATNKNFDKNKNIKLLVIFFCIFSCLALYICIVYIFAFLLSKDFDNFTKFIVSHSLYQNQYLFLFISIRELLYDEKRTLKGEDIYKSVRNDINNFYESMLVQRGEMVQYLRYLPQDFQDYYDHLTKCNLCEESELKIASNLTRINVNCSEFLYGSLVYGIRYLFSTFIEEVRMAKDYYDIAKQYGEKENITHNYTLLGSEFYDDIIPKNNATKWTVFNNTEPMVIYNMTLHKNMIIINSFIFKTFFDKLTQETQKSIGNYNDLYSTILYISICFYLCIIVLFFVSGIVPFQINLSETIYKSKNMLSIIPKDVLATLPQVRKMLLIDFSNKQQPNY